MTAFTASVSGSTITVTPNAANETDADIVETLTVSVEGGNSLEATLTHSKPVVVVPDPTGKWTKVTTDKTDWSGTYLVVTDYGDNYRAWDLNDGNDNLFFVTVNENNAITAAGTTQGGTNIPLANLNNSTVTIAKTDGGYTILNANNQYISNTADNAAGMVIQPESIVGANTISLNQDKHVEIHLSNLTGFGFFPKNRRFRYFPDNKWNEPDVTADQIKVHVSLYEYIDAE